MIFSKVQFNTSLNRSIQYSIVPIVAAFISLYITGYQYGINNNIFHIPYVLGLANDSRFTTDDFYQTLHHFTSIVWPTLKLLTTESNITVVFETANVVSRWFAFVGVVYLTNSLTANSLSKTFLITLCLSVSPLLVGTSYFGQHGLFINYFTHTELTWGFIFMGFGALVRNKIVFASTCAGIIFAINAFVGVWIFVVYGAAIIGSGRNISVKEFVYASAAYALFAFPILIWVLLTFIGEKAQINFSYIEYIRNYFPDHFLIEGATLFDVTKIFILYLIGILSSFLLPNRNIWLFSFLAVLTLFLIGIPLPYVIDERFVFNLHLLRSDGLVQMLAIFLSLVAGINLSYSPNRHQAMLLGPSIVIASMIPSNFCLIVIVLSLIVANIQRIDINRESKYTIFVEKFSAYILIPLLLMTIVKAFNPFSFYQTGIALILVSSILILLFNRPSIAIKFNGPLFFLFVALVFFWAEKNHRDNLFTKEKVKMSDPSWDVTVQWIEEFGPEGEYLVPDGRSYRFQLTTGRFVWVDWKQGGAVMWSPAFHSKWYNRIQQLNLANNLSKYMDLAERNRVDYLVIEAENARCPGSRYTLFSTFYHVVCGNISAASDKNHTNAY